MEKRNQDSLIIGVSGVRGIVGETLTPEFLSRMATAFGSYVLGGKVVVGRDTRPSGEMIKNLVIGGLLSAGCTVIDLDICTTPSCQITIEELKADGGIMITGSHNPAEWNALKFFSPDGIFLDSEQGKEVLDIYYRSDFIKARYDQIKPVIRDNSVIEKHIGRILKEFDLKTISKRKFKVVLDSCNGAGSVITPILLEKLGCEVIKLYCEPTGKFPHNPEPVPSNLKDLSYKVLEVQADIGFAQDSDADRLAIVSEKGEILGEENSIALAVKYILNKKKGPVVINMSTTRAVDDIANEYGCNVIKTPIGEVNVVEKMRKVGAVIGGEGNGGIIYPAVHYGRDSLVGIAIVLQYMAETGKRISELASEIPKYYIEKRKIECSKKVAVKLIEKLQKKYKNEKIDLSDGIRVDYSDSWVHVRRSGTEPVVRIITESKSKKKATELNNEILIQIEEILKEGQ